MNRFDILRRRAAILQSIRSFFDTRGYLAVETPSLAHRPIPEAHIALFRTQLERYEGETSDIYLLPSPEYYLKRLLSEGSGNLYEICASFRNREIPSGVHSPEFTMLEYYTVEADGDDSLALTIELLRDLGVDVEPLIMTVAEAWQEYAGFALEPCVPRTRSDLDEAADRLASRARAAGVIGGHEKAEQWEDLFHRVFLTAVEPMLPVDRAVFLTRFPDAIPTLARRIPDTVWSDRWELYLGGTEIANCYGEETDPVRIRAFFEDQTRRIAIHAERVAPPIDEHFCTMELPRSSGVALGIDRLVAAILGERTIGRVISFSVFR